MKGKRALVRGVSGQDRSYLAKFLIEKGYSVIGTSRDTQGSSFANLIRLGLKNDLDLISMAPEDLKETYS